MPVDLAGRDQRVGSTRTLITAGDGGVVRRTVLPGGIRVVSESVPGVRSVAFGVWIGVGSRDETPSLSGASHYLEHLLFKGTKRRDALAIASALDEVGGELNAFTAKEYTCYYARVLDTDLPVAVDVVCDMVLSSVLASKEVDNERGVILEEIAMHDDDPGDSVHDAFADLVWPTDPLGRPVLGSVSSIQAMSRTSIAGYYRRRYRSDQLVITAAGNVEHAALVRLVKKALAGVEVDDSRSPARPRPESSAPSFAVGTRVRGRATEQANIVCGVPGLSRHDDRRFALGVLNAALGGGMSSRLFQEVREKRGLAYSVYCYHAQYADTGLFGVYAGCAPGARVPGRRAVPRAARHQPRHHGRGARTWQGPAARIAGPRSRGHRLADEPDRQGRARLRRADDGRGDPRQDRGGDPRRHQLRRRRAARTPTHWP